MRKVTQKKIHRFQNVSKLNVSKKQGWILAIKEFHLSGSFPNYEFIRRVPQTFNETLWKTPDLQSAVHEVVYLQQEFAIELSNPVHDLLKKHQVRRFSS